MVLNAPWYRRWIHHGLRFWDCADVGLQCDRPEDLAETIARALEDPPEQQQRRREIIRRVYPVTPGTAAQTAARAILKHIEVPAGCVRMFVTKNHHDGKELQRRDSLITVDKQRAKVLESKGLARRL